MSKFYRVYIEVTDICGLNCSFCTTQPANKKISVQEFETIIAQLPPYTKEVALHIMGDPLVLSDLRSYLEILTRYKMRAFLTTSGYYIANHTTETLLHPTVKQINISLNSFNKNSNSITLDAYLEPIFQLIETKLSCNIDAFINLRLWNIDEEFSERDFNESIFELISQRFGVRLDSDDICQKKPKNIRIAPKTMLHFDTYFEWPSLANPIYGDGRCEGLKSHFGILADGTVVPCCLDSKGVINLGDIHQFPLSGILQSSKTTAIIQGFKKKRAIEELCQKCSYKMRFS